MALGDAVPFVTAHWSMDEVSGTRVDDVNAHDLLEIDGATNSGTGKFGNGADFEADNARYMRVADHADLSPGDEAFTACLYINFEDQSATRTVFSKGADVSNAGTCDWAIFASGGTLNWRVSNGSGFTDASVSAPSNGSMALVIVTHDPTANQTSISVNAGTRGTASYSAGLVDTGAFLNVGADGSGSRFMDGIIDELIIVKGYCFSEAEEDELWNGGDGKPLEDWDVGGSGGVQLPRHLLAGGNLGRAGLMTGGAL